MFGKFKGILGQPGRGPAPEAPKAQPRPGRPAAAPVAAAARTAARSAPAHTGEPDLAVADVMPLRGIGSSRPVPAAPAPSAARAVAPSARAATSDISENPEELALLDQFEGKVLTAENGGIQLQKGYRQFIAALEDGTLLVAKSHQATQAVSGARAMIQRSNFREKRTLLVKMEDIRKIYEADAKRRGLKDSGSDTATMQKAVIELIAAAAASRCSDIHVEVKRFEAQIFMRSDGVIAKVRDMPSATAQDFCQAAFNMADASDASYKPFEFQGARITSLKTPLPEGVQAVRLQFNPLPDGGRYLVARLLYAQKVGKQADIDELGYTKGQIFQIKRMRRKPIGINIISGPTGSGKSTTLQRSLDAALRDVNYEKNVITVEDPPEYEILGARQLPVTNVKTEAERKEAFRAAIAASLRSDPDIVMIGEIRDIASASLAFQAAMTGHQVWASLHANSALAILDRLRDMGVEIYRLSDETLVTGLIGQRLVRVMCPHCKIPFRQGIEEGILGADKAKIVCDAIGEDLAESRLFVGNAKGCEHKCRMGYTGRTVVADVIQTDRAFMEFYGQGNKTKAYEYWLESLDGVTMPENALLKSVQGFVDPREVEDKVGLIDEIDPKRFARLVAELDAQNT